LRLCHRADFDGQNAVLEVKIEAKSPQNGIGATPEEAPGFGDRVIAKKDFRIAAAGKAGSFARQLFWCAVSSARRATVPDRAQGLNAALTRGATGKPALPRIRLIQ
jgi:hypothetical protein